VLADALAARGHRVLLIDAADPLRSGLADATTDDGPSRPSPHGAVRVRQARRGPICCARLEFDDIPVRSPALVPAPQYWASPDGPVDVTVIDIGWDAWALGATALQGPGGWLRCGSPTPRPVLAMRPSLPAARHTEQLLNRLAHWDHDGGAADIAAVAVIGAKKVPPPCEPPPAMPSPHSWHPRCACPTTGALPSGESPPTRPPLPPSTRCNRSSPAGACSPRPRPRRHRCRGGHCCAGNHDHTKDSHHDS